MKALESAITLAALLCAATVPAQQSGTAATAGAAHATNEANNPLTPKVTISFHDQWTAEIYGSDQNANAFLLRGVIPHELLGPGQLFRFTLPVVTAPAASGDTTGIGDLNLIDLFPWKAGGVEIAVGPQLTIPTATQDETGTGRWQAGAAGIVIAPREWGLLGGLVTWQASFAGDEDRADQNDVTAQPFFLYNLPGGWYLRSTATCTFDLEHDHYAIPLGAGAGKAHVRPSGTMVNVFVEPQWTLFHDGAGQPEFQVFAGLNLQFPLRR